MRQQFLVDTADTLKTFVYENNRKVVPASAALTVYEPGSSTKLIDGAVMTVGGDGQLSYPLTATHNDLAGENYKAVVSHISGGATYYATLFYDVVNSKLSKVITDEDIINELPLLMEKGWKTHGAAESGSTTTIVDAELGKYEDDYFTGGLATNLTNDETREITDFVQSTGTVTTTLFSLQNSAGHKYVLTRSFTREIQRAFEKIEDLLNRSGKRSHLILDPYDIREVHIIYSVAEVCKGLVTEQDGTWWGLWEKYEKLGYAIFKSLNLKYDDSDDGIISAAEEGKRMTRTIGRA